MSIVSHLRAALRKPVSRILLGSLLGQGLVLAVSPVLTRLYAPADFGAFALVTAVVATLTGVVSLSWERAIVLPSERADAAALVLLGLVSSLSFGTLLGVVAYAGRHVWSDVLGSDVLVDYWWLIPLTVTLVGVQAQLSSWLVRRKQYGSLAGRNAAMGVGQALTSVALGLLGVVPLGLLLSLAAARVASLATVGGRAVGDLPLREGWSRLATAARRYRRFPLVNTWSRLVNSLGLQMPVILLISAYGDVLIGFYALTLRVLASPVGIVVDATSQYFEATFSERIRRQSGGLAPLLTRFAGRMALIGIVPTVLVLVASPVLFGTIFGDEWRESGVYAQIVVLTYLAQFAIVPISRTLTLLERQVAQLAWDAARAVATISVVVMCMVLDIDFRWCIAVLTLVNVAAYLALFLLSLTAARGGEPTPVAMTDPRG
ncbi:lipopolysaccharide biosynthesis protein [Cellulomonas sp. 179-A 9B4 NHS]|uniref:lipopolysaccharide biosynthesis protein n=1 Tax=Cellulomonas sp. 179-A 9B4 NHS TaxID=3142379 RepID=UPI0039A2E349